MSAIRSNIIEQIAAYTDAAGISADKFSRLATGDHHFVRDLRRGKGVTLIRLETVEAYMTENPVQREAA